MPAFPVAAPPIFRLFCARARHDPFDVSNSTPIGQVHRILTRRTYIGEHEFNRRAKSKALNPESEVVIVPVPAIIDRTTFDAVLALLKARNPKVMPARIVSGPTLLKGLIHCAKCGGAMTIRTGKGGRYRYHACSTKARQGATACSGMAVPMEKLDDLVARHLEERLLQPERLQSILAAIPNRRQDRSARQRAQAMLEQASQTVVTPHTLNRFAAAARDRMRLPGGGFRRDHLRAPAQRVEVADGEVRIIGSKSRLLQTLTAQESGNTVPTEGLIGGGGGIRTHGRVTPASVFKTGAIDHSATPPTRRDYR